MIISLVEKHVTFFCEFFENHYILFLKNHYKSKHIWKYHKFQQNLLWSGGPSRKSLVIRLNPKTWINISILYK